MFRVDTHACKLRDTSTARVPDVFLLGTHRIMTRMDVIAVSINNKMLSIMTILYNDGIYATYFHVCLMLSLLFFSSFLS